MILEPANESDLAEAILSAKEPLHITGGGTRGMVDTDTGTRLSTMALGGVKLYEPGALTLVVGAGVAVSAVEAQLASERQRLAFEPADWRGLLGTLGEPTMGGMVAANISGPRRVQAGACRDALLGVRFVDGAGQVVKNGGRVMKNVTGYDLVKLMAGSCGTLGVLTELSLKVLPAPEMVSTLILNNLDESEAVDAMTEALISPYDVTGAAHSGSMTLIRVEGFAQSVAYRTGKLRDLLARLGDVCIENDPAKNAALWKDIRDVTAFHGKPGTVWRVSLRPSKAGGFLAVLRQNGLSPEVVMDWGGGLLWLLTPDTKAAALVRRELGLIGGHATLIRADQHARTSVPTFHPEAAAVAQLSAGLRRKFDPRGILNPGLMG